MRFSLTLSMANKKLKTSRYGLGADESGCDENFPTLDGCFDNHIKYYVKKFSYRVNPIYIKYDASKSALKNAVLLYNTYELTKDNIDEVRFLDICSDNAESQLNCKVSNLRKFVRIFFYEASDKSTNESTLQYFQGLQCFSPRLLKDFAEGELESLGLMISLALITQTFINIKFCQNVALDTKTIEKYQIINEIFGNIYDSSPSLLSEFDNVQCNYYKEMCKSGENFYFSNNPNSKNIFLGKYTGANMLDKDGFDVISYSSYNFPKYKALCRMMTFPKIDVGIINFFNQTIYNVKNPQNTFILYGYLIDFDSILAPWNNEFIQYSDWRKHSSKSIYGEKTIEAMFWDILSTYDGIDIKNISKILTGIEKLPHGGVKRLPKTKVVEVIHPDYFSFDKANFTVYIRKDCHKVQLKNEIDNLLKKK